jgi:hypothetical protein
MNFMSHNESFIEQPMNDYTCLINNFLIKKIIFENYFLPKIKIFENKENYLHPHQQKFLRKIVNKMIV